MNKIFNWGKTNEVFKEHITNELFDRSIYTKVFDVEEGDVVFDIGASIGPFTFNIIEKNPSHIFCFEPSLSEFPYLVLNTNHGPVTYINKGITDKVGEMEFEYLFEDTTNNKSYSTTFSKVIKDHNIKQIDFLKTDCEGGEYDIFTVENIFWIKENVRKISGEWHLNTQDLKDKFKVFRDVYLRVFPNFKIYSLDDIDITNYCWSDDFINYYSEILIFIDNRG
jgi:FkbM family methyltransferase